VKEVKADIGEYLKAQHSEFVTGFLAALYDKLEEPGPFNKDEYADGYKEGTQYRNKLEEGMPC